MVVPAEQKEQQTKPKKWESGGKLNFEQLFFIFLVGSVFGAIYEDVLIFVKTWYESGTGMWMLHRGVIYGPFNVIYGFGAAAMCWLLCRKKYDNWTVFAYAALLGGVVEYVISFLQEKVVGTISWDYRNEFLNINGRTTVPFMLVWGVLGLFLVRAICPLVVRGLERIPLKTRQVVFWVMLVFMAGNMLVSWTALIRQRLRHENIPALTPIGEFYDRYYNDVFLRKYFPNMERTKVR